MATTTVTTNGPKLTRKDFMSDQTVRWCPGCGDYAILATMQKVLPDLGVPRENIVMISGIGCSSRFPYYMNTYGIHSIHGRAPTLATGLKLARPELQVWVITGDGDGLSIGGNHLLHACRRNIDIKILLFNNRIYGLTKGQYSPTSLPGHKTKSSPMGSLEQAFNPLSVALGAEATFVARTVDVHTRHMAEVLRRAAEHKGTAFVEIYQNCLIYNDGAWSHVTDADTKDDNRLQLEHGKPLIFGKESNKGIRLNGLTPEVVDLSIVAEEDLLVHDETAEDPSLAMILARMDYPRFPVPLGVFRAIERPSYSDGVLAQIEQAQRERGTGDLRKLYMAADLWTVTERQVDAQSKPTPETLATGDLDEEYLDAMQSGGNGKLESDGLSEALMREPVLTLKPKAPITVIAETSLANAISQMQVHNIGCLLVTDAAGKLVGIFTERDVLTRLACQVKDLTSRTVGEFMTKNPSAVKPDTSIAYVLHLMSVHGFRHVPVVDAENHPVSIVSFRDVVHYIQQRLTTAEQTE